MICLVSLVIFLCHCLSTWCDSVCCSKIELKIFCSPWWGCVAGALSVLFGVV